jgi:DNA gyrase subunit A
VRSMGRVARGVRGMRLRPQDKLISLLVARDGLVLSATENGYGKCTPVADYPRKGRGGQGVISIRTTERNGAVVNALLMDGDEEMMLITDAGKLVRTRVAEVSVLGRNTQGVTLIGMAENERLVGVGRIVEDNTIVDDGDGVTGEDSESDVDDGNGVTSEDGDSGSDDAATPAPDIEP